MPFSASLQPLAASYALPGTFGTIADLITPGACDQTNAAGIYFKYFVAATDGSVTFVPYRNADAATLTMTVLAGMILPYRIRRVTASTATLHGVSDA